MNILDIIFVIPLVYGFIQGFRHGFVKEIGSLVAIVFGIYLARYWAEGVSALLVSWIDLSQKLALVVAYAITAILGTLAVHLIAYMLSKLLALIKLGIINKLIGAVFGAFKWLLVLSLVLNFIAMANNFAPIVENKAVKDSVLYKPIENVIPNVVPFLDWEQFKTFIRNEK
ncbi:MAG: CvpA family protein [Paludibacteraceae bacterium]|nr:CvpA family protein [Paludibacteraceae bacterium]